MNLEEDLRTTLHERATAAMPPTGDLLTKINHGVRRDVRRRRLAAGGAAVVAVVAALAVPMIVRGDGDRPHPRPLPAASGPPSPDPRDAWIGPTTPSASFSMRPGWVPSGAGPGEVFQMGPNEALQFASAGRVLYTESGPLEPEWGEEKAEEHTADVGGQKATVRTLDDYDGAEPADRYVGVRWKTPVFGQWIQVSSWGPLAESEVLRFARGLGDGTGAVSSGPAPFRFSEVPPGLLGTQHLSPTSVCFAPAQEQFRTRTPEGLCVNLLEEPFKPSDADAVLTVGDRRAELHLEAGSMTVDLGAGRTLFIGWDTEKMPFSQADIVRFAAGITPLR
jgi:hypothetical protein